MKSLKLPILQENDTRFKAVSEIASLKNGDESGVRKILLKYPQANGNMLSKSTVLKFYKSNPQIIKTLSNKAQENFLKLIRKKKTRTISGVTPVTVLTKPFPCPGKCIFCPSDVRMPKSYLSDEPGAQRATANKFDPYLQTYNRLLALKNIGHPIDKVELIILGGTWTFYPREYQIWFVKRCFDALNDFNESVTVVEALANSIMPFDETKLEEISGEKIHKSYNHIIAKALQNPELHSENENATWDELFNAHTINETAPIRCIGMAVETRPDEITEDEALHLRKLGCTKIQIGIQSLNDNVLKLNKRGHDVQVTRNAINILRQAGFKIHAHWMPNLYGSNPEEDIKDFKLLFSDKNIIPDELKIYPCSLIKSAELMHYHKQGLWVPYSDPELLKVLTNCIQNTPRFCRLTRIIRDIPSQDIVVGNKKTNFRQIAESDLHSQGVICNDIRSREIKDFAVAPQDLFLNTVCYLTNTSKEYFFEFIDSKDRIAGFLRLSCPTTSSYIKELEGSSIIREIHVYGESLILGSKKTGKAQHIGLGKRLIEAACDLSKNEGFGSISVISSIGTREYYEMRGFKLGTLYQTMVF